MDSHLSNAQRCERKADSLVKYGLYDAALVELDKSIGFLKQLKATSTRYENIQLINVQMEGIDRSMRSIAIKRVESMKKKRQVEALISKNKTTPESNYADHVIIEHSPNSVGYSQGAKLQKDDKAVLEELTTTNSEYKKVNTFLINEIEQLKRENEFLKVELLKMHMTGSFMDSAASESEKICVKYGLNDDESHAHDLDAEEADEEEEESLSSQYLNNSNISYCSSSGGTNNTGCSSGTSSSFSQNPSSKKDRHHHHSHSTIQTRQFKPLSREDQASKQECQAPLLEISTKLNRIDLSKYIDNDDDDESNESNDDDSDDSSNNHPPLEFTIDS